MKTSALDVMLTSASTATKMSQWAPTTHMTTKTIKFSSLSLAEMIESIYMSNTTKMKQMFADGNMAYFTRYFDGNLWYVIHYNTPVVGSEVNAVEFHEFEFPVPISDIGTATFLAHDKAMLFMRYVRKHLDLIDSATKAVDEADSKPKTLISSLVQSVSEGDEPPPRTQKAYVHYFEDKDDYSDGKMSGNGPAGGDPGDGAIKPGVM